MEGLAPGAFQLACPGFLWHNQGRALRGRRERVALIVPKTQADKVAAALKSKHEVVYVPGEIEKGKHEVKLK